MVAVRAIAERSKPYGRLLRPNGGVDGATVSSIFDQFDEDGDGQVLLLLALEDFLHPILWTHSACLVAFYVDHLDLGSCAHSSLTVR